MEWCRIISMLDFKQLDNGQLCIQKTEAEYLFECSAHFITLLLIYFTVIANDIHLQEHISLILTRCIDSLDLFVRSCVKPLESQNAVAV